MISLFGGASLGAIQLWLLSLMRGLKPAPTCKINPAIIADRTASFTSFDWLGSQATWLGLELKVDS